jgi:prepilin-type N-terminal cleavage/methylation domain-containing protein
LKYTARKLNQRRGSQLKKEGFTLVELLVVIAIIAILAAVVVLIINPLELTKRSRDAARLTDLANLQQAINVAAQEATTSGNTILCTNGSTPCPESSFPTGANTRKADGTGWVKVNLSTQKSVSLPTLPVDPLNTAANHYSYNSDGKNWEISAVLESDQQKDKMQNDGGNDATQYEVGSDLSLI